MSDDNPTGPEATDGGENRRNFSIELGAIVLGGIASLGPLLIGMFAFLDPLRGTKRLPSQGQTASGSDKEGFYHVASLEALTVGGAPQRFPVIADLLDGWNFLDDQPMGAVFVERLSPQEVRVFNATCPHAGCSVACDRTAFHCPCHNSSFDLNGSKRESLAGRENPSRRGLDELEVDPAQLAKGEVWVEFKNFYTGIEEKKPKL